jgi:hypothetical protein
MNFADFLPLVNLIQAAYQAFHGQKLDPWGLFTQTVETILVFQFVAPQLEKLALAISPDKYDADVQRAFKGIGFALAKILSIVSAVASLDPTHTGKALGIATAAVVPPAGAPKT